MSEKKRKNHTVEDHRASKKQALTPNLTARVHYVKGPATAVPVIASTPGVSLPKTLRFEPFARQCGQNKELLLQSSSHSMIDYVATEDKSSTAKYLKHYVAVYDPVTGQLQVIEARRMGIRSSVRQQEQVQEDGSDEIETTTKYSSRAALTHAFGTKKSRKAVASFAENALISKAAADNPNTPMSQALLSSMPTPDQADEMGESTETLIQANKPLPVPNLATNDITKVYPLSALVFPSPPSKTLDQMPLEDWKTKIGDKKPIECGSRFVAVRSTPAVMAVNANPEMVSARETLQLLRYTLILIELAFYLRTISSQKRIPSVAKWESQITGPLPAGLVEKIVEKYCPNGMGPTKNATTLLQTTILALTLHIPPPSGNHGVGVLATETYDIQQDLALKPEEIRHLFRELGCKWEPATDAELERWGLVKKKPKKEGGLAPRFAKLKFPIEFPKMSRGKGPDKKRRL